MDLYNYYLLDQNLDLNIGPKFGSIYWDRFWFSRTGGFLSGPIFQTQKLQQLSGSRRA